MKINPLLITDEFVGSVSKKLDMSTRGWGIIDPKEVCLIIVKTYLQKLEQLEARGKQDETTE